MVKSSRGVNVDFDVLKIKRQLASAPPPTEVKVRENFVEKRLKRKLKSRTIDTAPEISQDSPTEDVTQEEGDVDLTNPTKEVE